MSDDTVNLGLFVTGEKPSGLEYQFLDSNNNPIDISTGYTAKFVYREQDGAPTTATAAITNGVQGKVGYTWTGTEMLTPGSYLGEFWVGNLAQRYTSWLIKWRVRTPVGPIPNI